MPDGPVPVRRAYDRAEIVADGIVHATGICLGIGAVVVLIVLAAGVVGPWQMLSLVIYGTGLLTVLVVSALYNLWPTSPTKWILRRFDHSAIFLLIAATYTPFISQMRAGLDSIALLAGVWTTALFGIGLKLAVPGRFDRLAILLYLLIGWSGVLAYEAAASALPSSALRLIVAGGLLYTAGVIFHVWESLRFQNAIWHAFVLVAAGCHYAAVLDCMVLARS